ncbi:hypothetical protein K9K85_02745 [Patescibacteria group bacterium]|nr:hypothetical protein [Patescibacteria group bacterium]
MLTKNVHGYTVHYKRKARKGVDHLAYVLTYDEANSLFQSALNTMEKVKFEDRVGRNFTLRRIGIAKFSLKKRKGW